MERTMPPSKKPAWWKWAGWGIALALVVEFAPLAYESYQDHVQEEIARAPILIEGLSRRPETFEGLEVYGTRSRPPAQSMLARGRTQRGTAGVSHDGRSVPFTYTCDTWVLDGAPTTGPAYVKCAGQAEGKRAQSRRFAIAYE
jgi:hypothetical protein